MTEQSITGSFLIAHPRSEPNYFSETLIYVLDNDGQGSLGFVVNRAAETTLSDVLTEVPSELADASLLLGGPVQSDCLRFLSIHIADPLASPPNLALDLAAAGRLARDTDFALLPLLGYAGWSEGQLEQEISEDVWLVTDIDWKQLLTACESDRYRLCLSQLGFDPALLGRASSQLQ